MEIKNTLRALAIALSLAVAALCGCADDKGSYDYRSLCEPDITGVADSLSVLVHSRLTLQPDLGSSIARPDDYGYEWRAIGLDGDQQATVLSRSRSLDCEIELDAGEFRLLFTMTEPSTGLFWRKDYALTVSDPTSEGWMVLSSVGSDRRAQLSMVSTVTGQTYADVLKGNGMDAMHGPRRIMLLSRLTDSASPLYLLTDEGATRLSKNRFGWKEEYRMKYESAEGEDLAPYDIAASGFGKVVVSGKRAHYCEVMSFSGLYGSAINKDFNVAPYVGANTGATIYVALYLLYDETHRRFMVYCPLMQTADLGGYAPLATMDEMEAIASTLQPGKAVTGTAFDHWPEGCECRYMENTHYDPGNGKMGRTYAVLTDGARTHLYGIQLGDLLLYADCSFVLGKSYYADLTGCAAIDRASHFAFSSLKGYMYYSVGGTVYRVDLAETPLRAEKQIELKGETVTCLKFNLHQGASIHDYDLIVASERDGSGLLRIYDGMVTEGDFSSVAPKLYTGFGKIVDVTYRERIN